jgi:AcrR family transcriptional regulator
MNSGEAAPVRLGLRERKKLKTQRLIQEQALRLFTQQGYDETTIEQIAEAAEVSPSTFFRYFPTKEDVLFRDEFDALIVQCLQAQPRDKPPLRAVRDAMRAAFAHVGAEDEEQFLLRYRLSMSTPALRARLFKDMMEAFDLLAQTLAEWRGRSPSDPAVRTFVGAVTGVIQQAMIAWVESEKDKGFATTVDEYLARLEAGLEI